MSYMSNIIPRKKVVPVEARRVEIPPMPIEPPTAGQMPPPNVTQNILYVHVPAPQAPQPIPQPAEPAPREVHYHTTHVYHSPMRPKLGKGTSFMGSMGLVIGAMAIGSTFVPQLTGLAQPMAVIAGGLAGLGLLLAMLFRHVYTGIPMLGLIVAAAAYGLYLKDTGQLPKELPKIEFNTADKPAPK
jgi:hypothetical protein